MTQSFGCLIKYLREQRGWTQAELAEKVGRKRTSVAMLETSKSLHPNTNTLAVYAAAFGVSPEKLLKMHRPEYLKVQRGRPRVIRSELLCGECGWRGETHLIICPRCGGDYGRVMVK